LRVLLLSSSLCPPQQFGPIRKGRWLELPSLVPASMCCFMATLLLNGKAANGEAIDRKKNRVQF
jgi:hypothetical protein